MVITIVLAVDNVAQERRLAFSVHIKSAATQISQVSKFKTNEMIFQAHVHK